MGISADVQVQNPVAFMNDSRSRPENRREFPYLSLPVSHSRDHNPLPAIRDLIPFSSDAGSWVPAVSFSHGEASLPGGSQATDTERRLHPPRERQSRRHQPHS